MYNFINSIDNKQLVGIKNLNYLKSTQTGRKKVNVKISWVVMSNLICTYKKMGKVSISV